jgi:hypothetical protein
MTECLHCGKPIERVPFGGWTHTTGRAKCATGQTYATPKETR